MKKENQTKVIIFGVFTIIGVLVYALFLRPQSAVVDNAVLGVPGTATQCAINPSIVSAFTDALNSGTAVTVTNYYRANGVYTGTTAPTYQGSADVLATSAGYISTIVSGVPINCGANQLTGTMFSLANASLTYYSDNGLTALVQSTANETVKAAGTAYNWKLHFQGTDKKSTGKMLLIVELSVPANVSSVTLSGGQVVPVPNGYTRQATNGYAVAFLLPAISNTVPVDYYLTAQSASGKVITGQVYTSIFNVQPFVETDGTFSDVGNAWDSLNVAKYATSQTKNFIIA
jgi:hypothetical protein